MKITTLDTMAFRYRTRDVGFPYFYDRVPGPEREVVQVLTRITTDEGVEGYCFGGSPEAAAIARPLVVGADPLDREKIWHRMRHGRRLFDRDVAVVDMALWDVAGRWAQLPVYKLLGGFRDKVPAYASTMDGDDIPGGLNSPEAYAEFAARCQAEGYSAFKLHTWKYPHDYSPQRVVETCRAVRERVGPAMRLMLDPYHIYSRDEALYLGRELEKLDFYWLEEPLVEDSISAYAWLCRELDIPILAVERPEGVMQTRADWLVHAATDIGRSDAWLGGITALMKTVHLCESLGVRLEVHGGGAGNLHVLGAMSIPGEYYERGLLHPLCKYEETSWPFYACGPWLKAPIDPLDKEGYVRLPQRPGLGWEIDWDFIQENTMRAWS